MLKELTSFVGITLLCSSALASGQDSQSNVMTYPINPAPDAAQTLPQPAKVPNYWYVKPHGKVYLSFYGNYGLTQLDQIKNTTIDYVPRTTLTVANPDDSGIKPALSAALGYSWAGYGYPIRAELRYTYSFKVKYNASPLFTGNSDQFKSSVRNQRVLLNLFYDTQLTFTKWRPYTLVGLGLARNATSSSYTISDTTTASNDSVIAFAWSLGSGLRYPLGKSAFLDLGYQYVDLGKVRWKDIEVVSAVRTTSIESSQIHTHNFNIGLIWLL